MPWNKLLLLPYLLLLCWMLLYSAHAVILVWLHRRTPAPPMPPPWPGELPTVTVQLPIYNEEYVVERLIAAVGQLEWPRDRLVIQVLDDSTDKTSYLVGLALARLAAAGVQTQHVRRLDRTGYKAGALAHGMGQTNAEFLAIFDADFVPPPDFLQRALPHLAAPDVAAVQGRWTHLNRDESTLTKSQAIAIDGHFAMEQEARYRAGWLLNFNGSAGVWRRTAIDAAGGWRGDTLTEDLDLSYRSQLAGWRLVYDRTLVCPAELPSTLADFKAQQRRWATGSIQVARTLLPAVWRSQRSLGTKLGATLHLTHYAVHPLVALTAVLSVPCVLVPGLHQPHGALWQVMAPFALAMVGPTLLYAYARMELGLPLAPLLHDLGPLTLLGIGVAVSNGKAVLLGLRPVVREFERTRKLGDLPGAHRHYAMPRDRLQPWEWALALYCLAAALGLAWSGVYAVAPFLALDAAGFVYVAWGGRPRRAA